MSDSPPRLRFVLGSHLDLEVGGASAQLSPTQTAYLLLLAHDPGESFKREEVIRLMWSAEDDAAARHRVRQLTYSVNRKAGREVIRADGPLLAVDGGLAVDWDGTAFWERFDPPTAEYGDYLNRIADRLERAEELDAIRELDAARMADSPEAVLAALARGAQPPGAWRDLLWALLRLGRIREAEFEMKRLLGGQVPEKGGPVARQLARAADDLLSMASAGSDESLPLLGREDVMRRLHEKVVAESRCILLTGVRGVGRSRVLGQALATIMTNQEDAVLLSATGSPSERNVPFGGLGQLLDHELLIQAFQELGQPETEVIRRALPVQYHTEDSHVLAPLGGPGSYLRVAKSVAKLIQRAFGAADTILVIDDMEEIDRSTLEVVTRLILVSDVRLLATWCIEDETAHNDLVFRMQDLSPDLVHLRDLGHDDAVALTLTLADTMSEREAHDIAGLSGGRPGRIVELVQALGGAGPNLISPTLDQILRKRTKELSKATQLGLVVCSITTDRIDLDVLAAVMDVGLLEVSAVARELEANGLGSIEGNSLLVSSRVLRNFVKREVASPTRNDLHHRLATHLLSRPLTSDPAAIALHLEASGQTNQAATWYKKAGELADERTAPFESTHFFEKGFRLGSPPDGNIACRLGGLKAGAGDFAESRRWYGTAQKIFGEEGDRTGHIRAVLGEVAARIDAGDTHREVFPRIRAQFEAAERIEAWSLATECLDLWLSAADYFHSREEVSEGRSILRQRLETPAINAHFLWVGARLAYLGDREAGLRYAKTAYLQSRSELLENPRALQRLLLALWSSGQMRSRSADILSSHASGIAGQVGDLPRQVGLLSSLALWYLDAGDWERSETYLDLAESSLVLPSDQQLLAVKTNRALLELRAGRLDNAATILNQLEEIPTSRSATVSSIIAAVRLLISLHRGQLREARNLDRDLQRLDLGFPFASNLSVVPLARAALMRRENKLAEARAFLERAEILMRPANVPCAEALQARRRAWSQGSA